MKLRKVATPKRTTNSVDSTPSTPKTPWPFKAENGPLNLGITHVETLIERITTNKLKTFDESQLTPLTKLSNADLKLLVKNFRTLLNDLRAAFDGDPFFVEAYQNFSKSQLRTTFEYIRHLSKITHDAATDGKTVRFGRAPRKTKKKDPKDVAKKVLFLTNDKETGTISLLPHELIGMQQAWVYNAKSRKLGCYYAKNSEGLTAKGTTLLNYDEKASTTKTLRKPKEQISKFMSGGSKFWDSIRSVPQAIPERMSRDTVILKVA